MSPSSSCSRLLLALAIFAAGCTTQSRYLYVNGQTLRQASPELRNQGKAAVQAHHGLDGQQKAQVTLHLEQFLRDGETKRRLVDLLEGCGLPGQAIDASSCVLNQQLEQDFLVREENNWELTGSGIAWGLGLVTVGTMGGCAYACEEDSTADQVSTAGLYATGALAAGAVVWFLISCSGRWGQPGCRD